MKQVGVRLVCRATCCSGRRPWQSFVQGDFRRFRSAAEDGGSYNDRGSRYFKILLNSEKNFERATIETVQISRLRRFGRPHVHI